MTKFDQYNVVIMGGGLAGLTLALQLSRSRPSLKILVIERRSGDAPVATHKVGESTSELGAFYLREVVDLADHLTDHQLPKFGFRFFLSPEQRSDFSRRVEVGVRIPNPYQTHQIDRGILENELVDRLSNSGVEIMMDAVVRDVTFSPSWHSVLIEKDNFTQQVEARWIVDASGRSGLLKRKLGLEKKMGHLINASWFRVNAEVDMDDWSDDVMWKLRVDPGRRRLATNHLMGEGYWVWIIPLVSGSTSFGIVADPRYHAFDTFNTFEKSMKWLADNEPVAAEIIEQHRDKVMDFKVMKNFAYDSNRFYSSERWAVTGEAGAFMDPFYSPGSDFIALGNSWLTDLILRDAVGEDINLRSMIFERAHKELLNGWTHLYKNMYGTFGNTQVMLMKIIWDWASYWAVPCVLFMNNGYTDITVLRNYSSSGTGQRFARLNERMQALFADWNRLQNEPLSDHYQNVFDLDCLRTLQLELKLRWGSEILLQKVESNLKLLEQIAAEIFRRVSLSIHHTPVGLPVDPYMMQINQDRTAIIRAAGSPEALHPVPEIRADIGKMWLTPAKTILHEQAN